MYQKFDLQMFDDAPNFDGIDDDIVKELTGDTGEQASDTHTAEDNSDNKPEQEEQHPNNEEENSNLTANILQLQKAITNSTNDLNCMLISQ